MGLAFWIVQLLLIPIASLLKVDDGALNDALAAQLSQTACIRSLSLQKASHHTHSMIVVFNMCALFLGSSLVSHTCICTSLFTYMYTCVTMWDQVTHHLPTTLDLLFSVLGLHGLLSLPFFWI